MTNNCFFRFLTSKTGMTVSFGALILVFILFPVIKTAGDAAALPYWMHEHFFNTVRLVENFKTTGIAGLNPAAPANDVSPVWGTMLVLFSLAKTNSPLFFILIRIAVSAALVLSLYMLDRVLKALDLPPAPPAKFFIFAFLSALFLRSGVTGSDVVWAVPAVFLMALALLKMLEAPSFKTGFLCGLSLLAAVLCRVDTLGFAATALLVFYFQFNGKVPVTTRGLFRFLPGLAAGMLLPAAYLYYLYYTSGSIFPATELAWTKAQNMAPWQMLIILFVQPVRYFAKIPTSFALVTFPVILLGLTAYNSFPWTQKEQTPKDTVFYALIWFPVLQLFVLAFTTYIALPEYAFYPLIAGAPAALAYATKKIDTQIEGSKEKQQAGLVWLILGLMLIAISFYTVSKPRSPAYRAVTEQVKSFALEHPGTYAMGSGAGLAAYAADVPFVRLDGMAGDKKILEFLGTQSALTEVFKHYGVNYYVAVNLEHGQECFAAREPMQNHLGGTNKAMSDWLCAKPIFVRQADPAAEVLIFKIGNDGKPVFP